ncbi:MULTISPECIES: hypothetical protein [Bacillus]|uniref:hypothetical protein n=1 Tax=Bacillus amyloliquefaciens group TaxID=1938374 RepID=UPI0039E1F26F
MVKDYLVGIENYYEDVYLKVFLGAFNIPKDRAEKIAENCQSVTVKKDCIEINFYDGNDKLILSSADRYRYQFRICTKQMPDPVDVTKLSDIEIADLLNNPDYMITEDDLRDEDWSIEEAYYKLCHLYGDRPYFSFSSSSYFCILKSEINLDSATKKYMSFCIN